ncbi:NTP transferase domain-containing protein [Azotobacter chroococcum]|uniref:Nucleotidyl transferase n=1 Tax=Azotobacter chroococcum NCIMB 8003 TaxID=1328314 RepID=A0A0C4WM44_9GAMM|nr:phosphocholine cytidylyltransferase family protein [Azotobacter chroococcum]AJE20230.1 Nucleotidyl transferase [Azotobacter chroococcum NCIMB 8003]
MNLFKRNELRRAVILSAGQGRRLLPFTENSPKCLLDIAGRSVVEWQIDALLAAGIGHVTVVVGYGAEQVERVLIDRYGTGTVATLYNPFFEVADNLASCWMARQAMQDEFLLLNGDTLFELAVLERLLEAPPRPITLAIDRKAGYDSDDMKVCLDGERLTRVGKTLPLAHIDGESIGMMYFQPQGAALFRQTLEAQMRRPEALQRWYLSIIDQLAQDTGQVFVQSIEGLSWGELDFPADLESVRAKARFWNIPMAAIQD